MGDDIVLVRPGGPDINNQFTAGRKIRMTRRIYNSIKDPATGHYKFGELTAFFYAYDVDQDDAWQDDIRNNYPAHIINQIRDNVITVLSKVNPSDPNTPISLKFKWVTGAIGVTMTVHAAGHAHTMIISGLREPSSTSYVDRQKTKSY